MTVQIQWRRDTAANWTSANPVLLSGEVGYETDTNQFKIGNGSTAWASLAYAVKTMPSGAIVGTTDTQTLTNKSILGATIITGLGAGFQNMVVQTSGTGATYNLPTALTSTGARFKVTILGGGGGGGGTAATAGQIGGGGGSGGLVAVYFTYVAGQNSLTYTVGALGAGGNAAAGAAGGSSSVVYNAVTYTAGGGSGGQLMPSTANSGGGGGTATGGTLNIVGNQGNWGGTSAATATKFGDGGNAPLGFGQGGKTSNLVTTGIAATGYGAGGAGGYNGATATAAIGGAGTAGLVIIEY